NSTRSGAAEADPQHNESDSSANAAKVRGIFDSPHALGNEQGELGEYKHAAGAATATLDQGGAGNPRTRKKKGPREAGPSFIATAPRLQGIVLLATLDKSLSTPLVV